MAPPRVGVVGPPCAEVDPFISDGLFFKTSFFLLASFLAATYLGNSSSEEESDIVNVSRYGSMSDMYIFTNSVRKTHQKYYSLYGT